MAAHWLASTDTEQLWRGTEEADRQDSVLLSTNCFNCGQRGTQRASDKRDKTLRQRSVWNSVESPVWTKHYLGIMVIKFNSPGIVTRSYTHTVYTLLTWLLHVSSSGGIPFLSLTAFKCEGVLKDLYRGISLSSFWRWKEERGGLNWNSWLRMNHNNPDRLSGHATCLTLTLHFLTVKNTTEHLFFSFRPTKMETVLHQFLSCPAVMGFSQRKGVHG